VSEPEPPPKSKRELLFDLHSWICAEALKTMRDKNEDYGQESDPFFNFRRHGAMGIHARKDDKALRQLAFLERGRLKNEPFLDSIKDEINYSILLLGYLVEVGKIKLPSEGEK
jgi:hypothetical protein